MGEWKECLLGDFVTLHYGKALRSDHRTGGDVPVFSSAGITGCHDEPLVESNGLIIGRKGTVGKVYFSDRPFWCIDTAYYVLPDDTKYDLKYLYFLLQTLGLEELNEDSAVPGLNRDTAYRQNLLLPSFSEQKAIATILSSLDDKIDLLHRQNKTLEAMAETLFRQWFVEEAQEDWVEGKLGDIVTVVSGTTPKTDKSEYWNGEYHWTSPRDITSLNGLFLFDTERKITKQGLAQIGSGLLPCGSLLMSSRAPVGALAFAEIPVAINQGYAGIICDKGFSREFVYLWLKTNMDFVQSHANGSTFQEISKSAFRELDVNIPDNKTYFEFNSLISPVFMKMKSNSTQIRTLEKFRDTLLPKLMSGEIRVDH